MNGSGCKTCPVNTCHTLYYRGSYCAEQRAKLGLGGPLTNADRIRAMTDEELAAVLADHEKRVAFEVCLSFRIPSVDYDFEESTNELLNWLKQPAEVDHD